MYYIREHERIHTRKMQKNAEYIHYTVIRCTRCSLHSCGKNDGDAASPNKKYSNIPCGDSQTAQLSSQRPRVAEGSYLNFRILQYTASTRPERPKWKATSCGAKDASGASDGALRFRARHGTGAFRGSYWAVSDTA